MQFLLFVELDEQKGWAFRKPLTDWARTELPEVVTADADNFSEPVLLEHAAKLLRTASQAAVYFHARTALAPLGTTAVLVEELLEETTEKLVLLQGPHEKLQRLFQHTDTLLFQYEAESAAPLLPFLKRFFENPPETFKAS